MPDQKAKKTSKRPRRDPHAGRSRGSTLKTGHSGGPRTRLTEVQKAQMGKGMVQNRPKLVQRRQR